MWFISILLFPFKLIYNLIFWFGILIVAIVVVDGVSLEQELLDNKLAYGYDGGKKLSWCR